MKKIEISFIIPCYNCFRTLGEAVDSIIDLNLEKYEICMVDDGSKDDTWKVMKYYYEKYPCNIKIKRNKKNLGGGATRNCCFELSKFPYIFVLDSDNILISDSFFRLIESMNENDDIVTFGIIKFFYSKFLKIFKIYYKDLIFLKSEMNFEDIRKTMIHPVVDGNYLYKREVFEKIGGYDTDLGAIDTWSFGFKALTNGYKYKIIRDAAYLHRVDANSYWFRDYKNNFENIRKLLIKYPNKFTSNELKEIKNCEDITKFIVNKRNDFFEEKINPFFRFLLKIHNRIFLIQEK